MTSIQRVLIVGGGIAGLTAAIGLARQGVSCDVLELYDRPAGAGITIQNRAVDALAEIGVLDEFMAQGLPRTQQGFFAYFDAEGRPVPTPPMPSRPPSDLPQALVIHRVPMSRILRTAAEQAGVRVRDGMTVTGLDEQEDGVVATLSDQTHASYDLVIGADGVRSTVRGLILGDEVQPTYSGSTMLRWVVPDVPDVGPVGLYQAERLLVLVRLRDGSLYLATGRHYDKRPGRIEPAAARQMVREHLEMFTAPLVVELTKRLTDESVIIVNDYDWLMTPDPWHRGRVLLIGDAAHATTATLASGGGMAIEDGAVLAQEVCTGGSIDDILGRFMKRRFDRTRLVVETSVELDRMLRHDAPVSEQNALRAHAMGVLATPY